MHTDKDTKILVREPQNPSEGEYTLDNNLSCRYLKMADLSKMSKLTISTSAF